MLALGSEDSYMRCDYGCYYDYGLVYGIGLGPAKDKKYHTTNLTPLFYLIIQASLCKPLFIWVLEWKVSPVIENKGR